MKNIFNIRYVKFILIGLLVFVLRNSQAKARREYIGLKCGYTRLIMFYPGLFEKPYGISVGLNYQTATKHQFGITYTYVPSDITDRKYYILGSFDYFLIGKRNRFYLHSEAGLLKEPFLINEPPFVINYSYKFKESAINGGVGVKYLVLLGGKWYLNFEGVAGLNYMFSERGISYPYELYKAAFGSKYKDQIIQFSTRFELGIQKMF